MWTDNHLALPEYIGGSQYPGRHCIAFWPLPPDCILGYRRQVDTARTYKWQAHIVIYITMHRNMHTNLILDIWNGWMVVHRQSGGKKGLNSRLVWIKNRKTCSRHVNRKVMLNYILDFLKRVTSVLLIYLWSNKEEKNHFHKCRLIINQIIQPNLIKWFGISLPSI